MNSLDVPEVGVERIIGKYYGDLLFGPFVKSTDGEESSDPKMD